MASPQLAAVMSHLLRLRARRDAVATLPAGDVLRVYREVVADYFAADPDCLRLAEGVTVRPAPSARGRSEWLVPADADSHRRLLYIHGGGFIAGSVESYRGLASRMAVATRCATLVVDYRLAPEDKFPAGLEDCIAAYRAIHEAGPAHGDARMVGASQEPVAVHVAGDSAGGALALGVLIAARDRKLPPARSAAVFSPCTDLAGSGETLRTRADVDPIIHPEAPVRLARLYLPPGHDPRDPLASPLHGNLTGLPPLYVQVGDVEVMLSDSTRLADRAKTAGVPVALEVWPEMPHVFQGFAPLLPDATQAIARVVDFFRTHA